MKRFYAPILAMCLSGAAFGAQLQDVANADSDYLMIAETSETLYRGMNEVVIDIDTAEQIALSAWYTRNLRCPTLGVGEMFVRDFDGETDSEWTALERQNVIGIEKFAADLPFNQIKIELYVRRVSDCDIQFMASNIDELSNFEALIRVDSRSCEIEPLSCTTQVTRIDTDERTTWTVFEEDVENMGLELDGIYRVTAYETMIEDMQVLRLLSSMPVK